MVIRAVPDTVHHDHPPERLEAAAADGDNPRPRAQADERELPVVVRRPLETEPPFAVLTRDFRALERDAVEVTHMADKTAGLRCGVGDDPGQKRYRRDQDERLDDHYPAEHPRHLPLDSDPTVYSQPAT